MAQIGEIAAQYRELARRGVQVYLVSPQSEANSQALAKKMDAPMRFMTDPGNAAAHTDALIQQLPTLLDHSEGSLVLFFAVTTLYTFTTAGLGLYIATLSRNLAQAAMLAILVLMPMIFAAKSFST